MADVFLALQEGLGGFEKLIVVKRMAPWFLGAGAPVEGFLREARVAAAISHPNVVTTIDVGRDEAGPYIVMEYLSGETLSYVIGALKRVNASMPPALVCRVGIAVASGLEHAHHLKFPDGTVSPTIHRDVSPSNIMCCYSGAVKLLDFGVAKVLREDGTKDGTIRGKYSYLAPEQVAGGAVDARTDVFQLGIVLWEAFTSQRLFSGQNDAERLHAVLARPIRPPSAVNPAVPVVVDRAVMWALERDPAARCPSARALAAELEACLALLASTGGEHEMRSWLEDTFRERHEWRLELERRSRENCRAADPASNVIESAREPSAARPTGSHGWGRPDGARSASLTPFESPSVTLPPEHSLAASPPATAPRAAQSVGPPPPSAAPPGPARARWVWTGGVSAMAVVFGLAAPRLWPAHVTPPGAPRMGLLSASAPATPGAPSTFRVDVTTDPAQAQVSIDGVPVGAGVYRGEWPSDGRPHRVAVEAPGYVSYANTFSGATMAHIVLAPLPPTAGAHASAAPPPARLATAPSRERPAGSRGATRRDATAAPSERPAPLSAASTPPAGARAPDGPPATDNRDPWGP